MSKRISEGELVLPTLQLIKEYGQLSTSEIIKLLEEILSPTGEDANILSGRKDTKFSQKVRNLMGSHYENNKMNIYTIKSNKKFSITEQGNSLLRNNYENVRTIMHSNLGSNNIEKMLKIIYKTINSDDKVFVYDENDRITEGEIYQNNSTKRKRSQKLRKAAIKYYTQTNGSIKCAVCGFDFKKVYHELGEGFIEMHHEHPIYQLPNIGNNEFIKNAIKDIKPVCANCHRMIHRNREKPLSIKKLKKIIKS